MAYWGSKGGKAVTTLRVASCLGYQVIVYLNRVSSLNCLFPLYKYVSWSNKAVFPKGQQSYFWSSINL